MENINFDIYKKIVVNADISLRPIEEDDAQIIFNRIDTQRAYLSEWLPFVKHTLVPNDSLVFVRTVLESAKNGEEYVFVIEFRGEFAGVINLRVMSVVNKIVDVGYWLSQEFQKKGVISHSVQSLCHHAFDYLGMNRVQIRCGKNNEPSKKVPQRLGFTYEGIMREGEWVNGKYIDLELYSLLKKERHKLVVRP